MVLPVLGVAALLAGIVCGTGLTGVTAGSAGTAPVKSPVGARVVDSSAPNWSSLEQNALQAVSGYQDVGPLSAAGPLSDTAQSSFTEADGQQIPVVQRSVATSDGQALNLTLLGGTQLVVTTASAVGGTIVVLQPGTSTVSEAYALGSPGESTAPSTPATSAAGGATAVLTAAGGCFADPGAPGVIGSIYGPLVMGVGEVQCSYSDEDISILASIDENGVQVSGTAGGSAYSSYLQVVVYSECTPVSWTNAFQTAELWSINGVLQGGAVSGANWLNCE